MSAIEGPTAATPGMHRLAPTAGAGAQEPKPAPGAPGGGGAVGSNADSTTSTSATTDAQTGAAAIGDPAPTSATASSNANASASSNAGTDSSESIGDPVVAPQLPDGQSPTAANIDAVAPPAGEPRNRFRAEQDAALQQDPAAYWSANVGGIYVDADGTAYVIQSYDASTQQVRLVRNAAETENTPQPGISRADADAALDGIPASQRADLYGPHGAWEYASGPGGAIYQASYDEQTGTVTWTEVPRQYVKSYGITIDGDGSSTYSTLTYGQLTNGGSDYTELDSTFAPDASPTGSSVHHRHDERDGSGTPVNVLDERAYFDGAGTIQATSRITDQISEGVRTHTENSTAYANGVRSTQRVVADSTDAATGDPISSSRTDLGYTPTGELTRAESWSDDYGTFTEPGSDAAGFGTEDAVSVRRRAHQVLDAQGAPLQFDEQGEPINATGTIDVQTFVDRGRDSVDDHDQTRDKVYVQHGTYGEGGVEWQSLTEQDGRFGVDPAHRWQFEVEESVKTYAPGELGPDGFPKQHAGGWRGLVGTALSVLGEVLIAGSQPWGAGLIGIGTLVMLSQDLPAFVRNPSFGNAVQVGVDVVGGLGGAAQAVRGVRYLGTLADAARMGEGAMLGAQYVYNAETGQYDGWQQYLLGGIGVGFAARGANRHPMRPFAVVTDVGQTTYGATTSSVSPRDSVGDLPEDAATTLPEN